MSIPRRIIVWATIKLVVVIAISRTGTQIWRRSWDDIPKFNLLGVF